MENRTDVVLGNASVDQLAEVRQAQKALRILETSLVLQIKSLMSSGSRLDGDRYFAKKVVQGRPGAF